MSRVRKCASSSAVRTFIEQRVLQLAQTENCNEQTQEAVLDYLALNANDTFLWLALVCQNLQATVKRNV
jgi:hypothetical protein